MLHVYIMKGKSSILQTYSTLPVIFPCLIYAYFGNINWEISLSSEKVAQNAWHGELPMLYFVTVSAFLQ